MEERRLDWIERFSALEKKMQQAKDEYNQKRIRDLMEKLARGEWIVAFCGHFSAGKSTLLNTLFGQPILPTSPIPTSANVVRIQKGEDRVKLVFSTGRSITIPGQADEQDLKSWCKNGEEVWEVHIHRADAPFPENVVLMDTPGIDSTDEAHQQLTESALHLADVLFYVMDYNHVQSEVNLRFVKKWAERGKQIYLVVNQIDKHQEQELPFAEYQQNVANSFREWGILIEHIYYTSLLQPDLPENQWDQLKQELRALTQYQAFDLEERWKIEAHQIVNDHLIMMNENWDSAIQTYRDKLDMVNPSQEMDTNERMKSLQAERSHWANLDDPQSFLRIGLEEILKNAYLMPFELREMARQYLETILTPFKVGFIFTKSKTEQEKKRREDTFLEKLKEVVQTQCHVHVTNYLVNLVKEFGLPSHWEKKIYSYFPKLDSEFLRRVIKQGATFTDAYLLTYTNDLAEEIKQSYRSWGASLAEDWKEDWQQYAKDHLERIEQELLELKEQEDARQEIERISKEQNQWKQDLVECLSGKTRYPVNLDELTADQSEWITDRHEWEKKLSIMERSFSLEMNDSSMEKNASLTDIEWDVHHSADEVLQRIRFAKTTMEGIDVLQSIRKELEEKLQRAEEKRFTVALFGAFSAGKSSLANALIGQKVFAVSPHPTTATIQKIVPPSDGLSHGNGIIHFKTRSHLEEELKNALRLFHRDVETWEEIWKVLPEVLQQEMNHPRQKLARPFLEAVFHGIETFQHRLGTKEIADFDVCRSFSAEEKQSCFVEMIEWVVDCPLTQQGMSIVDTPGADSIHRRHTEVAFQYIRSADAILYVTYYNHPFSKADREFLLQLGRVKDAFARDKMFFIINAADLARSDEDLHEVVFYVTQQLQQHGIIHPRLYALSSLLALKEKEGIAKRHEKSLFSAFEQDFTRFVLEDLSRVAYGQMTADIERGIQWLNSLIETAEANQEEQAHKQRMTQKNRQMVKECILHFEAKMEEKALEQEIHELIYYVKQRVFLRYRDAFVEIFNPAILRDDEGEIKQKLVGCANELVDFLKHDFMQEMKATALRIEKWLTDRQMIIQQRLKENVAQIDPQLILSDQVQCQWELPVWGEPFTELSPSAMKKVLSLYKNAKQFFEKNGRENMREEMFRLLEPLSDAFIQQEKEQFVQHYRSEWKKAVTFIQKKARSEANQYYDSVLKVMAVPLDVKDAKERSHRLNEEYHQLLRLLQLEEKILQKV